MYPAKEQGRNNYQYYSRGTSTSPAQRAGCEPRTNSAARSSARANSRCTTSRRYDVRRPAEIVGFECTPALAASGTGSPRARRVHHPSPRSPASSSTSVDGSSEGLRRRTRPHPHTGAPIQVAVNISTRQFRDRIWSNRRGGIREIRHRPGATRVRNHRDMLMEDVEAAAHVRRLTNLGINSRSTTSAPATHRSTTCSVSRSTREDRPLVRHGHSRQCRRYGDYRRGDFHGTPAQPRRRRRKGVETTEQLKFLSEHDCEYGQGYYFSKPLPFAEIQRFFDPNVALMRQPRKRPGS